MAHLVKKLIKGKPYWYARECRRVNGKVVTVWQRYLGTADSIVARLTSPPHASPGARRVAGPPRRPSRRGVAAGSAEKAGRDH